MRKNSLKSSTGIPNALYFDHRVRWMWLHESIKHDVARARVQLHRSRRGLYQMTPAEAALAEIVEEAGMTVRKRIVEIVHRHLSSTYDVPLFSVLMGSRRAEALRSAWAAVEAEAAAAPQKGRRRTVPFMVSHLDLPALEGAPLMFVDRPAESPTQEQRRQQKIRDMVSQLEKDL